MVFNIVANLIVIPRYQAMGAAVVSLATQSLTAVIQIIVAFSIFGLKFKGQTQLMLVLYAIGVVVIGLLTKYLPCNWFVSALVMITLSGVLAVALKLIRVGDFIGLLNKSKSNS
jgi:O-antigen/teichoic acid export membrane protein